MKRFFLFMIACCFFAAQGFGQDSSNENQNAPVITFEETEHNFGKIPLNGVAEYEFTFVNTGKEPLIIQSCQSTCGCTVPACPDKKPILPGEKGSIKVKYTTTHVAGPFDRYFNVISNAKNSMVRVTIKGEIAENTQTVSK